MKRPRARLTYANTVATLALFAALAGGVALALDRNSVRSKHIVNGQVKVKDAQAKAFGRGIQFATMPVAIGGVPQTISIGFYPIGHSTEPDASSIVVPTKMRLRDLTVNMYSGNIQGGTAKFNVGVGSEKRLSCTLDAARSECRDPGPSPVLRPGELISFTMNRIDAEGAPGEAAVSWRAATP